MISLKKKTMASFFHSFLFYFASIILSFFFFVFLPVRLYPNETFGRMLLYSGNDGFLEVCEPNFNDNMALLACRDLGFPFGMQLYLPPTKSRNQLQITRLHCEGRGSLSIQQCEKEIHYGSCGIPYPAVICSENGDTGKTYFS